MVSRDCLSVSEDASDTCLKDFYLYLAYHTIQMTTACNIEVLLEIYYRAWSSLVVEHLCPGEGCVIWLYRVMSDYCLFIYLLQGCKS